MKKSKFFVLQINTGSNASAGLFEQEQIAIKMPLCFYTYAYFAIIFTKLSLGHIRFISIIIMTAPITFLLILPQSGAIYLQFAFMYSIIACDYSA
jgi:hypothetical protein